MPASKTLAASYEEKVIRNEKGCWGWRGAINHNGYAVFCAEKTYKRAHVYAWEVAHGRSVPKRLKVLHECDVRYCSRPDHLRIGTQAANLADMVAKGRQCRGELKIGQAKLTDEVVREIRLRYVPGLISHAQLAVEYGVSRELVSGILRRQRWSHVT